MYAPCSQALWLPIALRWRTHRKSWTRRLRQADNPREVAICMREFHEHLRTDKTSGLFAAGGAWELSLRECVTGWLLSYRSNGHNWQ